MDIVQRPSSPLGTSNSMKFSSFPLSTAKVSWIFRFPSSRDICGVT